MLKDNALKDGPAKARPGQAVPPLKAKPARLRAIAAIAAIGGWIAAPLRAARRWVVGAFGAVMGFLRGLVRWEVLSALGVVIAVGAAALAWSQSVNT